jgi:hypothetical protein
MSSSAASSFSFVPEMLQHSIVLGGHLKARIQTALQLAVNNTNSEHHTGRCALMLVLLIFSLKDWDIVPQFYTNAGKWPDFAIERFYYQPGSLREVLFIANVFLELKKKDSPDDPIEQLRKSILMEHGVYCRSKGVLIGVKGVKWRFMEYHFVKVPNQEEPELLLRDFHDFTKGPEREDGRPTPSRDYAVGDYMDFELEREGKDIIQALLWVAKGKHNRDLMFLKHHASALPQSFTRSTLENGIIVEPDHEEDHKLGSEF